MKITCPACGAKYAIADDKVRGRRVKVRCKSCNEPIIVDGYSQPPPPAAATEEESTHVANAGGGEMWSVNLTDTDQRSMTTNEIISMWNSGQMPPDTFVWKEGMGDWVPVQTAAELAPYLNGTASQPAPAPIPTPAPAVAANPFARSSAARLHTPAPAQAQSPSPARVAGGRARGADLFGGFAQAGSEEEAMAAAAAAPAPGSTPYAEQKPTGARNENSVLFSLDALKVGGPASSPSASGGRVPVNKPAFRDEKADLDDIMNLGGGGGGGMFGLAAANQALLNAPPPPPEPKPRPVFFETPASTAPAAYAPPQKNQKMLIAIGGGIAGLVILALVIALVSSKGDKTNEGAKADTAEKSDKKSESAAGEKKDDKAEKKDESSTTPASSTDEKKPLTEEDKKRWAEAKKKEDEAKGDKKEGVKTDETVKKDEPSSGVATFNKGAAISALGAAAAQASGCKRPGGPTGSGKAVVTFAPSGKVTSANIGGDFAGTPVGSCVAGVFQRAQVPAFSGDSVTVSKAFTINP